LKQRLVQLEGELGMAEIGVVGGSSGDSLPYFRVREDRDLVGHRTLRVSRPEKL
jgi:hypothetical protein